MNWDQIHSKRASGESTSKIEPISVKDGIESSRRNLCPPAVWMPPFRKREDIGHVLDAIGAKIGSMILCYGLLFLSITTIGVELGVRDGDFARNVLSNWQSADKYVMVDVWNQLDNYADGSNVELKEQLRNLESSRSVGELMKKSNFVKEVELCRNFTSICVNNYPDRYFDFIYVDAR